MKNISVVIPCYNSAKTIINCLISIGKSCEIILIDDFSCDDTVKVIEDFKMNNPEYDIKLICNVKNCGAGNSRNLGIKNVTGKYILFVDSDDELVPNCIDILNDYTAVSDYDCIIFDAQILKNNKSHKLKMFYSNKINEGIIKQNEALVYTRGCTCGKLYKADVIKKFNVRFGTTRINEDLVFTKTALMFACKIYYINKCLYIYKQMNNSLMHKERMNVNDNNEISAYKRIKEMASGQYSEEMNSIYFLEVLYARISRLILVGYGRKMCKNAYDELAKNYKKPDKYFKKYLFKYKLAYLFIKLYC